VKVGKIVSDTRLIVNMEGFILSDDESKAPLANKNIYITNQKGEQFFATTTDDKGRFQFKNLPFDKDYLIEVEGSEELALQKKKYGFFEYSLLETEKMAMSSISEPDPWMKITTLSAEKKQLEIIENIYYESGSATLPKAGEELLMKAVEALKSNPKLTLEIES